MERFENVVVCSRGRWPEGCEGRVVDSPGGLERSQESLEGDEGRRVDHTYLLIPVTLRPNDRARQVEHKGRNGVDCNGKCIRERGLQGVNKSYTPAAQ
jgi:hypothetical protein